MNLLSGHIMLIRTPKWERAPYLRCVTLDIHSYIQLIRRDIKP